MPLHDLEAISLAGPTLNEHHIIDAATVVTDAGTVIGILTTGENYQRAVLGVI
ncbi:hypothetical protein [Devosia salina]|uniref:CBS domain-containing protein n=1 Tax=Devosia salina TaxID=2860336 RepID=A0ABX8WDV2_9HYPH|nr:hypothetical protein [Devosia salina]QYO76901.1 hypothetical protein K1X15_20425 [Devosia salina]